jgi:hypothetical protein
MELPDRTILISLSEFKIAAVSEHLLLMDDELQPRIISFPVSPANSSPKVPLSSEDGWDCMSLVPLMPGLIMCAHSSNEIGKLVLFDLTLQFNLYSQSFS